MTAVAVLAGRTFLALPAGEQHDTIAALAPAELDALLTELRELRDEGERVSPVLLSETWREWRRKLILADRDPGALRRDSRDEVERFWAWVIRGLDGCLIWDGPDRFQYHNGKRHVHQIPQHWVWRREGRTIPHGSHHRVLSTCGSARCVNVDHLALVRADRRHYSDERLIGAIQALTMRLGHVPTTREWIAAGWKPTPEVARQRWGSWANYCRAAGLEPPKTASRVGRKYDSEEAMLADLARWAREHGFAPTEDEWNASGWEPSGTTFRRRFRSWGRAREAAGLPRRSHTLAEHPLRRYARGLRLTPRGSYLADESLDDVQQRLYREAMDAA